MRSKDSFRVAFFLRRNVLKNGESPVFMRITVNGQRAENNIQKSILPNLWSQAKERASGTSRTAVDLNRFIEEARIKVHAIVTELQQENEPVTATVVQQRFYGINPKKKKEKTILEVIQAHNDEAETLIGKDYTKTTVYRYKSMKRYLEEMIKKNYEVDDLPLSEFTGEVIRAYEVFLKTEKDLCQNTLIRYMKALKKITNRCIANDWIKKDPFVGIKFKEVPTEPDFLTIEELNRIYECEPGCKRLEVVRDMFLMSAFTGLAFSDVSQLTSEHIVRDNAGNLWIRKHRQKTRQISNIPLLDIPAAILKKYEGNKKAAQKGVLLPVPANQVMNRYLKEIATICKIDKYLTTHVARHTYATVCLSQGVSLKNVSKMLGHASVKMTEHYARVLDTSILREMNEIRNAMNFSNLGQQAKAE
ncbi:site-specific integrase [uncultured Duncaniella sp.]|uniref:site-specific integrase n=1 Tax=uncultured Duncaniella sp. TaxID=2768039 RepID=UPI0025B6C409|nr:site-specific integrase [uncultured Duncaniella sp.]